MTMIRSLNRQVMLVPLAIGASSIATLLVYFYGFLAMGQAVTAILLPAAALLAFVVLWAKWTDRSELYNRVLAGLWAGALATLAYDLVRVPLVWSGLPVFKAISYFGTVILNQPFPTAASEIVGWTYHLSNGIGFGLMYTSMFRVPRLWSAVLWSLALEGTMVVTPYAEVFGYRTTPAFLAITLASHVVYGATLWAMLTRWSPHAGPAPTAARWNLRRALALCLAPMGIAVIALDFNLRQGHALPASPPTYIGQHLYTTWNVLEPDRLAALWVMKRFVEPRARFHFVQPFSQVKHGHPFDIPEADVRRGAARSATEELLSRMEEGNDPRLQRLARMTHLYEITPWMRPTDPEAAALGQGLLEAKGQCGPAETASCVDRALRFLDGWYGGKGPETTR